MMCIGNMVNFAFIGDNLNNVCLRCGNRDFIQYSLNILNLICHLFEHRPRGGFCVTMLRSSTPEIHSLLFHLYSRDGTVHGACHFTGHV